MRLKPQVLVIDDDPMFRKALESVIPRFGLDIKVTSHASEFLEAASKLKPDLCLIDLELGTTNDLDLLPALRQRAPSAIVMVISGADARQTIAHALETGADDFILKPIDRPLLAAKLARHLHTEALDEHRTEYAEVPEGSAAARLTLSAKITEMDELGVWVVSAHLVPKGTVLKLKSESFRVFGAEVDEVLVSVITTAYDHEHDRYRAYCEFEDPPTQFADSIRRWLTSHAPK